ncbi:MAG: glycosyltransferase family 2 protein [Candidatus Sericytochromatia bacterium]|nr:glycosyltransferase family 2 protein [Candidatus Sericytochromatia bacterium]
MNRFSDQALLDRVEALASQLWEMPICETGWGSVDPEAYFQLLQSMPWEQGILNQGGACLEGALQTLMQDPENFAAHAILGLYKRRLRFASASGMSSSSLSAPLQALLNRLAHLPGRPLEILPAVQDLSMTLVMITYNRLPLLKRAVQAILDQTYSDWKLILLDHGSQDGTTDWCRFLEQTYPDKIQVLYRAENQGLAALGEHYQALFEAAESELVLYQSDDDWLLPDHLACIADLYKRFPWIGMASGSYAIVNPEGQVSLSYGPFYSTPTRVCNQKELQRAFVAGVCPQASVFRKSVLKELGPLDFLFGSEKNAYAIWDYLVTVKHLGQFEVAYSPEKLAHFYSSEQTAYAQTDFTAPLLKLMKILLSDYQSLFGPQTFPTQIMQGFLQGLVLGRLIGDRLKNRLSTVSTVEALNLEIAKLEPSWETYLALKTELLTQTSPEAEILIHLQNPYV